jgi:cysteine-rich repeat protein
MSSNTCEGMCQSRVTACPAFAGPGDPDGPVTDCLAACAKSRALAGTTCAGLLDQATSCVGSAIDWEQVSSSCAAGSSTDDAVGAAAQATLATCGSEYALANGCWESARDRSGCCCCKENGPVSTVTPFYDPNTGSGIRIVTTFETFSCWASSYADCKSQGGFGCWVDRSTGITDNAVQPRDQCLSELADALGNCIPSARRCQGRALEVCGSDRQWAEVAQCAVACLDGHCVPCQDGEIRCHEGVFEVCGGSLQWHVPTAGEPAGTCAPGGTPTITGTVAAGGSSSVGAVGGASSPTPSGGWSSGSPPAGGTGGGVWVPASGGVSASGGAGSGTVPGSTGGDGASGELVCGDGLPAPNETCDDGNQVSDDGCSSACQVESGYLCPEFGKPCVPVS